MVDVFPTIGDQSQPTDYTPPSHPLDWIGKQPFNADLAHLQVSNYAPGKVMGGPSTDQYPDLINPRNSAIFAKVPALTDPAIAKTKPYGKFGSFTLDLVDPETTGRNIAMAFGATPDQAQGAVAGPEDFLASHDLNLFGAGPTGVPARLLDTDVNAVLALAGQAHATTRPVLGDQQTKYAFETAAGYWQMLSTPGMDDTKLAGLASSIANEYVSGGANDQLSAQLLTQFKEDQKIALGLTSGDAHTDYVAMMKYQTDLITAQHGQYTPTRTLVRQGPRGGTVVVPGGYSGSIEGTLAGLAQFDSAIVVALPVVDGTGIAKTFYTPPKPVQDGWNALSREQRMAYYQGAGSDLMLANLVTWAPVMGAMGPAEAVIANAGRYGKAAVTLWNGTRSVMTRLMATGLAIDAANWTAEAIDKQYAATTGSFIDNNRPISSSHAAALINQLGFFSSGTFGANLAVRTFARLGSTVADDVAAATGIGNSAIRHPLGVQEAMFYADAHGGSKVQGILGRALPPEMAGTLEMAPKEFFLSALMNVQRRERMAPFEEAVRTGAPIGNPAFDALSPDLKIIAANERLAEGAAMVHPEAVAITNVMRFVQDNKRPLMAGDAQAMWDRAKEVADYYHTKIRDYAMAPYIGGEAWLARKVGSLSREEYAMQAVERMGGDPSKLGKHDDAGWAQIIRYLDNVEYRGKNAELHAVIEGPPIADEGGQLQVMSAHHVFRDEVPAIKAKLEGTERAPLDPAAAKAEIARIIRTTPEGGQFFADWQAPAGMPKTPENVPPAELAAFLDEIETALPVRRQTPNPNAPNAGEPLNAFHTKLEAEGNWTLAFKPTDEAGNFVSYIRRGDGSAFQSPWIDYPLGNAEDIALGNRTILGRKLDAMFRGFDTIRITEFQRGLLYKRLRNFDVTPEQVEEFNLGVYRIAQAEHVQPQTVGLVAGSTLPLTGGLAEKVNKLAASIFGPGELGLKAGGTARVDWADVIAKSYRQSLKLNLTAGVTSMMKAYLPGGGFLAYASDPAYVAFRFGLSPVFHVGNWYESAQINWQYGARNLDGPASLLWSHVGVGMSPDMLAQEAAFDPLLQGLDQNPGVKGILKVAVGKGLGAAGSPEARSSHFAQTAAFYSNIPERTLKVEGDIAHAQGAAAETIGAHMGGNLPAADWIASAAPQRDLLGNPIYVESKTRVVLPSEIPDSHTTLLGDVRPDLLSADALGEDQGFWHATTALNKVYDEGVKARQELRAGAEPNKGETWSAWQGRGGEVAPMLGNDTGQLFVAIPKVAYERAIGQAVSDGSVMGNLKASVGPGAYVPAKGLFDAKVRMVENPGQIRATPDDVILEVDPKYSGAGSDLTTKSLDIGAADRVWTWDASKGDHVLTKESTYARGSVPAALGGGFGKNVSTTYLEEHAAEIARRLAFAGKAARNEVTNAEILDHFAHLYGDDYYTMAKVLGANPLTDANGVLKLSTKGPVRMAGAITEADQLAAWMDTRGNYKNGQTKYGAVVDLDGALSHSNSGIGSDSGFSGAVILAAGWQDAAKIDPGEVGYVRLAVRKGAAPKIGADQFELEFNSHDLLVIDDRQRLAPLADTEEELLAQLRETLATEPKQGQLTVADHLVGGNGITPGLETRAREILTKLTKMQDARLDEGPTFTPENITPEHKASLDAAIKADGWAPAPARPDLMTRSHLDGSVESKPISQLYDEYQRKPGGASSLDEVAGTAEAFTATFEREAGKVNHSFLRDLTKPTDYKMWKAGGLAVHWFRENFPSLLDLSGNAGLRKVLTDLKVPQARWADWLIEDRLLEDKFIQTNAQEDFAKLLDHAGGETGVRGEWDAFYKSEDWATLRTLIRANLEVQKRKAFAAHFFETRRSWIERTINHPLLGIYPASWTIKIAKVWLKFLYDNQTLGIHLGMAPAQAIGQITRAQAVSLAQHGGDDSTNLLSEKGPLGSAIFIANLILPGDWSGLPFSTSRTIRDISRPLLANGTLPKAEDVFWNNLKYIGASRDVRLITESLGELGDILRGPQAKLPVQKRMAAFSLHGGVPSYNWRAEEPR